MMIFHGVTSQVHIFRGSKVHRLPLIFSTGVSMRQGKFKIAFNIMILI